MTTKKPDCPCGCTAAARRYKEVHTLFHVLWTKAVSKEGYIKSEWRDLGHRIDALWGRAEGKPPSLVSHLGETVE